jgi:hypothetical protein
MEDFDLLFQRLFFLSRISEFLSTHTTPQMVMNHNSDAYPKPSRGAINDGF